MQSGTGDVCRVVVGSLVVAAGLGLVGVSAFDGGIGPTLVGFFVFFAGYTISQGGHASGGRSLPEPSATLAGRFSLVGVGGLAAAFGVTTFADTIVDPSAARAALAGISCIGGYMFTHLGINGNLL
jgi:hypothetical protein